MQPSAGSGEANGGALDKSALEMVVIHQGDVEAVVAHLNGIEHFLAVEVAHRAINDAAEIMNRSGNLPRVRRGCNNAELGSGQGGEGSSHGAKGGEALASLKEQ